MGAAHARRAGCADGWACPGAVEDVLDETSVMFNGFPPTKGSGTAGSCFLSLGTPIRATLRKPEDLLFGEADCSGRRCAAGFGKLVRARAGASSFLMSDEPAMVEDDGSFAVEGASRKRPSRCHIGCNPPPGATCVPCDLPEPPPKSPPALPPGDPQRRDVNGLPPGHCDGASLRSELACKPS
eukprot:TRINITY_DN52935_c0_g1_i1.p1 TRINITY_DN52935_c0_g1~~TRINITY_DN52935_c0_g1_i1.p1  ORF type:complete len:183 (-),score=31.59 TRINITY_DN52935_c0_g1_i1:23-571(-)